MQTGRQEQIDSLLETLSRDELLTLLERIAQRLRQTERKPQPLYGVWKGKFPEDGSVEDALQEIRNRWTDELKESQG